MRSPTARQGLNGLAFFTAAVQTGFGPFIAVYLTERGWSQTDIGVALSTASAMVTQVPSGMLVDHVHGKRGLTAAALLPLIHGGDVPGGQAGPRADRTQFPSRQRVLSPHAGAKASPGRAHTPRRTAATAQASGAICWRAASALWRSASVGGVCTPLPVSARVAAALERDAG
jgi:hypothetical protein